MKNLLLAMACSFITFFTHAQKASPAPAPNPNLPLDELVGDPPSRMIISEHTGYTVTMDSVNKMSGKRSVRIDFTGKDPGFKAISFSLPANYPGKKMTVSGYIKTENVSEGWAGLWMRIDPGIGFDNMNKNGVKGTTDWKRYEVTLDMDPESATNIFVGGLLVGRGSMWLDSLTVRIDGQKIISGVKILERKVYPAQKDSAFYSGSGITQIQLTPQKIEDLRVLGLVWGFVKYYHPGMTAGNYNADFELFRVLPGVLKAKNVQERDEAMLKWINGLDNWKTDSKGHKVARVTSEVKLPADVQWIENSSLKAELVLALKKIKEAKRPYEHYYVQLHRTIGNPQLENEQRYAKMKYPDAGYRLLALYRYWNTIQYLFPYRGLIDGDWKAALAEFIPHFLNSNDESQFVLTCLQLIARVTDTHANLWSGNTEPVNRYLGKLRIPVDFTFAESKLVVKGFPDSALGAQTGLQRGDIVTRINGRPIDSIVSERMAITPASNQPTRLREIALNLARSRDSILDIEYERKGVIGKQGVKALTPTWNAYSGYSNGDTCFKLIKPNIAYLYLGTIKNKYLPELYKTFEKTDGLIIDLRCYPSEFVVFTLTEYLKPSSSPFVKFSVNDLSEPGKFMFTLPLEVGKRNNNYYKGKVVILVNEYTQSQAEYNTMALQTVPGAVVIGSTTAGADGNISPFALPGNIGTVISGIGVYYPDGRETQRVGIVPDIEVKPTIEGIRQGRDEVLEKAISVIEQKK